jgi:hypothetical protein
MSANGLFVLVLIDQENRQVNKTNKMAKQVV